MLNTRDEVIEEYEEGSPSRELAVVAPRALAQPSHQLALDPRTFVPPPPPAPQPIGAVNVHNSKGVTVGTKILNITVDNREKVKGHLLGLEFVSQVKQPRRVRCSCAVCACWVLLVAAGFFIFFLHSIIHVQPTLIDVGLNDSWYLRRDDWQAVDAKQLTFLRLPVAYVVLGHTVTRYCTTRLGCINQVRAIQNNHMFERRWPDIGINFLVGGRGIILEGRGANVKPAFIEHMNSKIISIAFLGDYSLGLDKPDEAQIRNVEYLLERLVELQVITQDYRLVGKCQLTGDISPGGHITRRLMEFSHWHSANYNLSFCSYLSNLVRNTSRVERYACAVIASLVLLCVALGLFFVLKRSSPAPDPDQGVAWYVDRAVWLAESSHLEETDKMIEPVPLVVINHSAGAACYNFKDCAAEMRMIQSWYIHGKNWTDGPYNFALGTDGRVYEGRGWGHAAAHTLGYNRCALGIGFIGDYRTDGRETKPTEEQVSNMYRLLELGVQLGHLRRKYVIVGHCDIRDSDSPGNLLYELMQKWPQYNTTTYSNMTCDQIFELIGH